MARRIRRRNRAPTVWLDWTPEIARHFVLVPQDWCPPLKVRITGSIHHTTIAARFLTPAGYVSTARVRLEPASGRRA